MMEMSPNFGTEEPLQLKYSYKEPEKKLAHRMYVSNSLYGDSNKEIEVQALSEAGEAFQEEMLEGELRYVILPYQLLRMGANSTRNIDKKFYVIAITVVIISEKWTAENEVPS